ncbi:MAG: nuclear transport factor 2 family protein [Burkholderiales bacterium]|nr:nuclear transport factor 2 family protein [Burkholderiales bacterium]
MKFLAVLFIALLAGCAATPPAATPEQLREQVRATEIAFARTMADRNLAAFSSFLAEETVFFSPRATHGKDAVTQNWSRFYQGPKAPFSWAPDEVEVLKSGSLAISSGPVHDPDGKLIGRFMSIWRLEAPGQWKVIFDKGCNCPLRP